MFKDLEKKINYSFKNENLIKEALTHRSYLNENPDWGIRHNERLEFLGDAVLELIVTEFLFQEFPKKEEGELTLYRSALVNTKTLALVSEDMGIDNEILMSRGEAKELSGRGREAMLANVCEAVIGAIYIDGGYASAKKIIERFVMSRLDDVVASGGKDAKSLVQEAAQSNFKVTPIYKVHKEEGPAHKPVFNVGLYFGDKLVSEGIGPSKQEAELMAADTWLKEEGEKLLR